MKIKLPNTDMLIDISTIHNGIRTGELDIYNGSNIIFTADIGINHAEIDELSLELYRKLLFETPLQTGVLDIMSVLTMMKYITPNFNFRVKDINIDDVKPLGFVYYMYDNEVLTTIERVNDYMNPFFTQDDGDVYMLANTEYTNLYVSFEGYDEKREKNYMDLTKDYISYTMV